MNRQLQNLIIKNTNDIKNISSGVEIKPTSYLYVGKNGNDITGDGSANAPFLSIGKAITMATSGTTVFIFPGTYTENLTLKANVNLTSPAKYSVYVRGNIISNMSGTVYVEKIVFQSSSGFVLDFQGTTSQNFQALMCNFESLTGNNSNAINYSNTNSASKISIADGVITVYTSTGGATAITSTSTSYGSILLDKTTVQLLDNINNICINLGGNVSYTQSQDQIKGQVVCSNAVSAIFAIVTMMTTSVPVLVTNTSVLTNFSEVVISTSATPSVTGAGSHTFVAVMYAGTGAGGASTLNGGLGSISLPMGSLKLRIASLLPAGQISAGTNTGGFEFDGTHLYFTIGTIRNTII
jgi:hypothetical protein